MGKEAVMSPEAFAFYVGQEIYYFRNIRSLTQEELGAKVFLNKSVISRIERGGVGASLLDFHLLCIALGVTHEDLLPPLPVVKGEEQ